MNKKRLRPALALIPARAGSKGVPGKNLKRVGGRTLVSLAVSCARKTGLFDRIVVSSDADPILAEARRAGAEALRRPARWSKDTSNVADTIRHCLVHLAAVGFRPAVVVLLEPSCPLRTPQMVIRAVRSLRLAGAACTVSAVDVKFHAARQFCIRNGLAARACPGLTRPAYRQGLDVTYSCNGAAFAFRRKYFLKTRSVLGPHPRAVVISMPLVNIDTPQDLREARRLWRSSCGAARR